MPPLVSTLVAVLIPKHPDHRFDLIVADLGTTLRDRMPTAVSFASIARIAFSVSKYGLRFSMGMTSPLSS
ncbi:hypothetical protein MJ8_15600 [Mesorhizobium sp. J8]|nr:hypothetical protein MJ8_15600 [Mesorhizobium sp. J8]